SLDDVFANIRKKTQETPEGDWIVLRYAFPTRLKEARFPTRAELDKVAPKHPVLYHAGPAGITNTMGLKVSGITRDTPNPEAGVMNPHGSREQIAKRLEDLPGKDKLGGPTGVGGIWVKIGPIKFFLDGGMLNGTAYMRQPWPKGDTYQIVEDDYRGLLFVDPEETKIVVEEATRRKWQVTAHTAGEAAMDVLLDAYDFVDRLMPIKELRHCITHANFPSQHNL